MRQLTAGPTVPAASVARSRALAAAWRAGDGQRRLAAAFAAPAGGADRLARRAERLFADTGWLDELLTPLIDGLAADPWFEPPVRTNRDGLRSGAILFESAEVAVSLSVLSAARLRALPPPATSVFSGRLAVTKYLKATGATLRRWRVPSLPEPCRAEAMGLARRLPARTLVDGAIIRHDGRTDSHVVADPGCDVVSLSATIRAGADPVAREYDAATGRFLRMATNDEGAARTQVLLGFLRASGASGTAPSFDAATRDPAFFLRWSAMREWLAHDGRAAWPRLQEMASGDPHPEVRATAAATLAQLAQQVARHAA